MYQLGSLSLERKNNWPKVELREQRRKGTTSLTYYYSLERIDYRTGGSLAFSVGTLLGDMDKLAGTTQSCSKVLYYSVQYFLLIAV